MNRTKQCKLTYYAKLHGVSRNTVLNWHETGRLKSATITHDGLRLVNHDEPRPEQWKPWHIERQYRIISDT